MVKKLLPSKVPKKDSINSIAFFDIFWMCWKLMGISLVHGRKWHTILHDIAMNLFVTIYNPIHLTLGLLLVPTIEDVFKNSSANITIAACSLKHYLFRYKLQKVHELQQLLKQLDERIVAKDECEYFNQNIRLGARNITIAFSTAYSLAALGSIFHVLTNSERELLYPAWFPFDWSANRYTYYVAVVYQICAAALQIVQNLAHDSFPPIALCVLAGQVHLLAMRVAKVGYDDTKSLTDNEFELNACIEDHKKLLRLFDLLQDIFQYTQLVQFVAVALTNCVTVIYLLFYVNSFFGYMYYLAFFSSITLELLPVCYYGTKVGVEFQNLPYAIFECNWIAQGKSFQQNVRIFTELAKKTRIPTAGGIIDIHLTSFVATCKMAYSLYTLLVSMK